MKKIILLFILFASLQVSAQNGFASYGSPAGYTNQQLALKNALAIDNNNNKWIAYQRIGLGKFDGSNWTMFDITNSSLPSDTVNSLAVDGSNNLGLQHSRGWQSLTVQTGLSITLLIHLFRIQILFQLL